MYHVFYVSILVSDHWMIICIWFYLRILILLTGFMYSADADGRGHFLIFFLIVFSLLFFFVCLLACIDLRGQLERDPESDRLGHPAPPPTHHDLMKIYWVYHPYSTTALAQRVGMVAVGTTTLAQRRHGRRRHNYGGATSFSQRIFANHMPKMSAMLEKIRSENTFSLIFWGGICFPGVKYKISHKNGFELKCTIYITYLWR